MFNESGMSPATERGGRAALLVRACTFARVIASCLELAAENDIVSS